MWHCFKNKNNFQWDTSSMSHPSPRELLISMLQSTPHHFKDISHMPLHFSDFFGLAWADIFQPLHSNQCKVLQLQFQPLCEFLHIPFVPIYKGKEKRWQMVFSKSLVCSVFYTISKLFLVPWVVGFLPRHSLFLQSPETQPNMEAGQVTV